MIFNSLQLVLAICVGSFVGALLRRFARPSAGTRRPPESRVVLAVSIVGGGLFGVLIAWTIGASSLSADTRELWRLALMAALAAFGAAATAEAAAATDAKRNFQQLVLVACMHLGATFASAALTFAIFNWLMQR